MVRRACAPRTPARWLMQRSRATRTRALDWQASGPSWYPLRWCRPAGTRLAPKPDAPKPDIRGRRNKDPVAPSGPGANDATATLTLAWPSKPVTFCQPGKCLISPYRWKWTGSFDCGRSWSMLNAGRKNRRPDVWTAIDRRLPRPAILAE
jgi:hypothetical protein